MSDISKIKLPNGDIYNLKDSSALHQGDATIGIIEGITKQDNNLITILDGAKDCPIEELKINFGPYQEGNGDPSPENIRPIIGWTEATIFKSEKNLFNPTIMTEPGVILADGTIGDNSGYKYTAEYIPIKGNTNYYLSGTVIQAESAYASIAFYDINKNFLERYTPQKGLPSYGAFVSPVDARYIRLNINSRNNTMENIQLERGLISTNYTNINQIFNIQFPSEAGTVYGGTLDLVTGLLTLTHKSATINETTQFDFRDSGRYVVFEQPDMLSGSHYADANTLCDKAVKVVNSTGAPNEVLAVLIGSNNTKIYFYHFNTALNITTASAYTAWIAQNPITYTYPLATPIIYQLTPQQINTLLGENNIWTNINSTISIKYAADTKLFIQQNTVKDVQLDNTSIVNNGIASIPYASTETPGVGKINSNAGITLYNGFFSIYGASDNRIKSGNDLAAAVVAANQHTSTFYGLAKAAGVDERTSSNATGTYTDAAKGAIQHMIGTDAVIAPYEADITADRSYAIDDTFMLDGKLYKATAAIAQGGVITPNTNCIEIKLEDIYVKNTDYANSNTGGVVKIGGAAYGLTIENGQLGIAEATTSYIKQGNGYYRPLTSAYVPTITFYGLAKAAGDTTQIQSDNAVGTYTDEAKVAIQTMLNVPDTSEVVNDVQINSTSIINNGVANIPLASTTTVGAVKLGDTMSITGSGAINFRAVGASEVKAGTTYQRALSPERQHASVFYGLTKAAGVDMKNSDNAIGVYTNEAKTAICNMIGASDIVKVQDTQPTTPTTELWIQDSAQAAVQVPTVSEMEQAIEDASIDVQINGTSITSNGVANIPLASITDFGIIRLGMLNNSIPSGIAIDTSGKLFIRQAYSNEIPAGSLQHPPITPSTQHISTFYGLAKAAGDTTQAASSNAVGTYTSEAKTAIQQMIGLGTINASTVAATLDSTSKTYLLGTQSTITSTAANVSVSGDTSVYLTTNQGQISATQHSINVNGTEKAYMTYNTTDQSIDFIFI